MPLHPLTRFFLELKRRRVIRVAIGYAVAAGALMQSVSVIFPALRLPEWTTTFVVVLCLAGFPLALALAWAFDLTPQGLRGGTAAVEAATPGPPLRWRVLIAVVIALLVVAGATTTFFAIRPRHGAMATPDAPVRLAVLYFDDRSPDGSLRSLADGVTEELIERLSAVPALRVVTANGVAPFRGHSVALDSVARALHASVLVSGTVKRSGDVVRVSAQLSDSVGTVLRALSIDHHWGESLALVDDLVTQVSGALRSAVGEEVTVQRLRAGTGSEEAWRELQLARSAFRDMEQLVTAGDWRAGIRVLESADTALAEAERLDPHWPEPVVQRAWNAGQIALLTRLLPGGGPDAERALARALAHAERAVALAPGDARALEVRGTLRSRAARERSVPPARAAALTLLAQRDLEAAVDAGPLRARAAAELARILLAQGRFAEARVAAEKAYTADAYLEDPWEIVWVLFQSSFELGDDNAAHRWCAENERLRAAGRAEAAWPSAYCGLELLAWADPPPPNNVDPWAIVERVRRDPPPILVDILPRVQMLAAVVLARTGHRDSALATAARVRAAAPANPALDYLDAAVHVELGDAPGAVARLRVLAGRGLPGSRQPAESRMFRGLRADTAYQAVVRTLR